MSHHRRVQRDPAGHMRRGHPNGRDWFVIPNDYFGSLVLRMKASQQELIERLAHR